MNTNIVYNRITLFRRAFFSNNINSAMKIRRANIPSSALCLENNIPSSAFLPRNTRDNNESSLLKYSKVLPEQFYLVPLLFDLPSEKITLSYSNEKFDRRTAFETNSRENTRDFERSLHFL